MEQSFSQLFRSSAFASLHPRQVLAPVYRHPSGMPAAGAAAGAAASGAPVPAAAATATAARSAAAAPTAGLTATAAQEPCGLSEWGLKHTLRTRAPYVSVRSHDDKLFVRPHTVSALHRVTALRRWKENFPAPEQIAVQTEALADFANDSTGLPAKPLAQMDSAEWAQWLQHARAKRPEFHALLAKNREAAYQWRDFLGLNALPSTHRAIHPVHYSTRHVEKADAAATAAAATASSSSSSLAAAPVQPSTPEFVKVRGRMLNTVRNNDFAVGIEGVVAYLHNSKVPQDMKEILLPFRDRRTVVDRSQMFDFWVLVARHDHLGRPEVIVSLRDPKDLASVTGASAYGSYYAQRSASFASAATLSAAGGSFRPRYGANGVSQSPADSLRNTLKRVSGATDAKTDATAETGAAAPPPLRSFTIEDSDSVINSLLREIKSKQ